METNDCCLLLLAEVLWLWAPFNSKREVHSVMKLLEGRGGSPEDPSMIARIIEEEVVSFEPVETFYLRLWGKLAAERR